MSRNFEVYGYQSISCNFNSKCFVVRNDILSGDWLDGKEWDEYKDFMAEDEDNKEVDTLIRNATSTVRPPGTERFIKKPGGIA